VEELKQKLTETWSKWVQALGNEKKKALALIDDLVGKFNKRWCEFTGTSSPEVGVDELSPREIVLDKSQGAEGNQVMAQSKEIIELRHKLNQALENVRQSESRSS
jgi:hypothetical protein